MSSGPPPHGAAEGRDWHAVEAGEAAHLLQVDLEQGLAKDEAARRLARHGPNRLEEVARTTWYRVLVRQFVDVLILVLVVAAGISLAIGEAVDAAVILAIVLLNGALGFVQEWRAERALEALRGMLAPRAIVVRDGRRFEVAAADVVPGDVVVMELGDRVPADVRVVAEQNLQLDESSLTGESTPTTKGLAPVAPDAALADRRCMVWMGTSVVRGHGRGVVVATGMDTQFGRIAQLTQTVASEQTPLQRRLAVLGTRLGILSVAVAALVGVVGWLAGRGLVEMFLTAVSLAVAVVPEGLPAVVTVTLALGVRSMVRRRALLRRLQAAETLGAATVICTDKTGTLTQGEMTVQRIWMPGGTVLVSGAGYDPSGGFTTEDGAPVDAATRGDLHDLLETGLLCNHADVVPSEEGWRPEGEPTEAALVTAAYKAGLQRPDEAIIVAEVSFTSARKRMTRVMPGADGRIAHVKGAPEVVLERCTRLRVGDVERDMSDEDREAARDAFLDLAGRGLRTLAIARRSLAADAPLDDDSLERDLTLVGVVGIIDPPRAEVAGAVRLASSAGIRPIMITGDAPATATAVATSIGMRVDRAVTGTELADMDDAALRAVLRGHPLFARTTPEHKLRIVSLLQDEGEVVGMTGDGVNDAPALKKADIGIAMGIRGTDVARESSDMVLTDDNFSSIIGAVEEGRRQYENIQKFVRYLLSSNTAEIVAILFNILIGGPLILLPVQILWMNLVTDGLTAVALGVDPAEPDVMDRPPRDPRSTILDRRGILTILAIGLYMGLATLWLFHHYLGSGRDDAVVLAQTVAFTGLIVAEKFNVFNFHSLERPLYRVGWIRNRWLVVAWTATVAIQVAAVYVPFLQTALHTVPLGVVDWLTILAVAAPVLVMSEVYKAARLRLGPRSATGAAR